MVMCVGIHRLGELVWVVDEALALEWKGGRRWGCSCVYQNMQIRGAGDTHCMGMNVKVHKM